MLLTVGAATAELLDESVTVKLPGAAPHSSVTVPVALFPPGPLSDRSDDPIATSCENAT
jgi:hypothetical protein